MEITILSFSLGILLLALPLYILYYYRINLWRKLARSFLKMLIITALTALFLKYIIELNNTFVNILWCLLMSVAASATIIVKARLHLRKFLLPVFAGVTIGSLTTTLYLLLLSLGVKNAIDAHFLIPILGLLIGNMITVNSNALDAYYSGMSYHAQLYSFLIGNGATHAEASRYLVRRSIEKTALPNIAHMGGMIISSSPVIMWAMILNGTNVTIAAAVQLLLITAMFCSSIVSTAVTLWIYQRSSFN